MTSSISPVGAPPSNVFFHEQPSVELLTTPVRPIGAEGATPTPTMTRTSFEGELTVPPADVFTRA